MEAEMRIPGHTPIRPELHYLKKDAVKIDAMTMLKQMKVAGKISVETEAEKNPGSKYSSTSGLSPRGHLERQAEFHASTQEEA